MLLLLMMELLTYFILARLHYAIAKLQFAITACTIEAVYLRTAL